MLSRHTLVWVRPECRAAVAAAVKEEATHRHVASWLVADRPLVVARQPDVALPDILEVGLALPPALGKCRIALRVDRHDIVRHSPPLRLAEVISPAPAAWQAALLALDSAAADIGLELRVFGSFAWQTLSGLSYLTPQSDIDLLWHPRSQMQLQQGIALLARWEQSSGMRADGEVLFGANRAVSWREWQQLKSGGDQRVLVKCDHRAELVAARELLELLV